MRAIPSALQAHLDSGATTLATCWKITRQDGAVLGFTDHQADLVVAGVTYRSAGGGLKTAVAWSAGLAVNNLEVQALLDSAGVTEADIAAGKYDYAQIDVFLVNYADTSMGTVDLLGRQIGEVKRERGSYRAEVRGRTQFYRRTFGELYSPSCRAALGDARCQVDLTPFTVTGTVTAVTDDRTFSDSARTEGNGWFDFGVLTWTSGANAGRKTGVKQYLTGAFELSLPMPNPIAVNDAYSVYAGCDKLIATCIGKFNNVVNFRGEPFVPGFDALAKRTNI